MKTFNRKPNCGTVEMVLKSDPYRRHAIVSASVVQNMLHMM